MKNIVCPHCYSNKYITYAYQNFICKGCRKIMDRCEICNYYCHNQCLSIFEKVLNING